MSPTTRSNRGTEPAHGRRDLLGGLLRTAVFLGLAGCVLLAARYGAPADSWRQQPAASSGARSASDEAAATRDMVGYLEQRVRRDPGDAGAYGKLAGLYLQVLRETGALQYLALGLYAAHTSLSIVPAVRNVSGLNALASAEFSSHEFGRAREHALALTRLDGKAAPYALLGDALLELGDYPRAEEAYRQMRRRSGGIDENVATRMARLAQLRGANADAARDFAKALALTLGSREPSHERIAWYEWQLGETAFNQGDYRTAQARYEDALASFPGYYRALASLARTSAARGDYSRAIEQYQAAIRALPDPTYVAALGDLYELAGTAGQAQSQYDLVEVIGHLGAVNGALYNRQLALFYADHDLKPREAYRNAKLEYRARHDIYGADAVAWTALKAGERGAARKAIEAALRLGTQDAKILYHAGMIYRAADRPRLARTFLERALSLNPQFDPLQAIEARKALATLTTLDG